MNGRQEQTSRKRVLDANLINGRVNKMFKTKGYYARKEYKKVYGEIPKGYHVHHKDKNRDNNSPDNIEALPPKEHFKRHTKRNRKVSFNKIDKLLLKFNHSIY